MSSSDTRKTPVAVPAPAAPPDGRESQPSLVPPHPGADDLRRMGWLLEASPDAMAVVAPDGRIAAVNGQLERLFNYQAHELVGAPVELLVPERFHRLHARDRAGYIADPQARPMGAGLSLFARRRDGSEFAAEVSLAPMPGGAFVVAAVRDITGRLRVEEQFRTFVESSPDAVVITDADGCIVRVNAQTERIFGYPREELIGRPVEVLVPAGVRTAHPGHRARYSADPRPRAMGSGLDLHGLRKDGTEIPVEISLNVLPGGDGHSYVTAAIRDVSERRRAEASRQMLAAIVDSSVDAIISTDLDGRITSWNGAAERMFGYLSQEVAGRHVSLLVPADRMPELEDEYRLAVRGEGKEPWDTRRLHRDGTELDVSVSLSPIPDGAGRVVGVAKVIRDISARRRAEQEAAAAREEAEATSAEFEAFSYSVAHDLRAPLRAMDGYSQALVDDCGAVLDDAARGYLDRIRCSAQRMAELIDSLLILAKMTHRELRHVQVDLSEMAREIAAELAGGDPGRTVEWRIADDLVDRGDPGLLCVVLDNLIGNAWKFSRQREVAHLEFGRDDDGYYVRDDGAGFDMAFAAKLFGVFQRLHTAQEFEGTGIGLATVQRVVRRHGGRVWADSTLGAGATFHFTLGERRT